MTQPVERRADEAASGWEEHSRRHSPRRLGRPVANAKPGSILRIEGSTTHTDVLLTRRGGQSCLRTGGIWEISDEVPAQPAARPSGSLSGVVCQPGLHVGALVWLGRWAVARCDGAVMLEPVALAWILLLPVIAGSVFADAFDWLPVHRRWFHAASCSTCLFQALTVSTCRSVLRLSGRICQSSLSRTWPMSLQRSKP